jgi:hypothetical protein
MSTTYRHGVTDFADSEILEEVLEYLSSSSRTNVNRFQQSVYNRMVSRLLASNGLPAVLNEEISRALVAFELLGDGVPGFNGGNKIV